MINLAGTAQRIAKATRATRDFNRLLQLSTTTEESEGILVPDLSGPISFTNVSFSYPERPDVPVLRNLFVEVKENECVAIVGSSGSGKSTIAALLQRSVQERVVKSKRQTYLDFERLFTLYHHLTHTRRRRRDRPFVLSYPSKE